MITDKSKKLLIKSGADVSQQCCQQSRQKKTRPQRILLVFIFSNAMFDVNFPQLNQHQVQLLHHPKQLSQVIVFLFYSLKIRDRISMLQTETSKTLRGL